MELATRTVSTSIEVPMQVDTLLQILGKVYPHVCISLGLAERQPWLTQLPHASQKNAE